MDSPLVSLVWMEARFRRPSLVHEFPIRTDSTSVSTITNLTFSTLSFYRVVTNASSRGFSLCFGKEISAVLVFLRGGKGLRLRLLRPVARILSGDLGEGGGRGSGGGWDFDRHTAQAPKERSWLSRF